MRPLDIVCDPGSILARVDVLDYHNFVANNINIAFNLNSLGT